MAKILKPKQERRKPLFCDICGRIVYKDSPDYEWWLVGTDYGTNVIRCPQHITTWSLRISGKGRHMANYRWMRLAKEQDTYDYDTMMLEPFWHDPTEIY